MVIRILRSALLFAALPAMALPNRVFVASTGMDVGTCPITSPCRSFSYAKQQVALDGEIIALDTAGYGIFEIDQGVSVYAAPGVTAFIAVGSLGVGIDVITGPSDAVVIRGLALSGFGALNGIQFDNGHSLSIENCVINGFINGVSMQRNDTSNASVRIENCTIRNDGNGVITSNASSTAGLTVVNSVFSDNTDHGVFAEQNTRAAISDSTFSGNLFGVEASTTHTPNVPQATVVRCTLAQNTWAIMAGGNYGQALDGIIRIAENLIAANYQGVLENPDGKILSMTSAGTATNVIEGNQTNGTFTGTYSAK